MSKGDTPRPMNKEKYDESFESVFGRKEIKTWNPDGEEEDANGLYSHEEDGSSSQTSSGQTQGSSTGGSIQ
ncbi:hypothetical protein LCGC14_0330180 [marine sediment metagenome]|uniref:Uncharacterized protein n=1 Tax=marine sediment metagenome TaxID=412755 RepID=A0A0F9TGR9_9ZZZZ